MNDPLDEMIEKAALAIADNRFSTPNAWDMDTEYAITIDDYRNMARIALESAGALPPEPPPSTVTVEYTGKLFRNSGTPEVKATCQACGWTTASGIQQMTQRAAEVHRERFCSACNGEATS